MACRGVGSRLAWASAAFALTTAGCGDGTVKVSGTATHAGKPLPDLMIVFTPEKGLPSRGLTDEGGRFTLRTAAGGQEGVVVGTHKVSVQLRPVTAKDEKDLQDRVAALKRDPAIQAILKKYGKPETTPRSVEVKQNNQVIALDLD